MGGVRVGVRVGVGVDEGVGVAGANVMTAMFAREGCCWLRGQKVINANTARIRTMPAGSTMPNLFWRFLFLGSMCLKDYGSIIVAHLLKVSVPGPP